MLPHLISSFVRVVGWQATSAVYASAGSVFVVIYGERLNLRNYWSGAWLSVWQIDTTNGNTLSGSVKVGDT